LGCIEVGSDFDTKQDIATRDQMRPGGQAHDAEVGSSQSRLRVAAIL